MDFSRQPLLASDVAAVVFGALALIFLLHWIRDRERGSMWMGVGYGLLAVHFANDASLLPTNNNMNAGAAALHGLAAATISCGLLQYFAAPASPSVRSMALVAVPTVGLAFAGMAELPLPRPWSFLPFMVIVPPVVLAALKAARREKSAGHEAIAIGLVSIPGSLVVLLAAGVDSFYVRYYSVVPLIFFGLMLLTVSLLRRRRALELENELRLGAERALTAANASPEQTIASRTADLQNIVAGLKSFNRNVSHDLRGSLGGMSSLARAAHEALQRNDATVAQRVLPLIATQADQSSDLVTALLTLARVGDHDLNISVVDLRKLTQDVISDMVLIKPQDAMPRFIISALSPVRADAALLRPVLTNLIGNAVKFCGYRPDACAEVSANADAQETVVQVRDNGVGFSRDQASELFQPFMRLHGTAFTGHGVGLSIVRRAIEWHGGRVWAEAAPDRGASFYFSLPHRPEVELQALVNAALSPA